MRTEAQQLVLHWAGGKVTAPQSRKPECARPGGGSPVSAPQRLPPLLKPLHCPAQPGLPGAMHFPSAQALALDAEGTAGSGLGKVMWLL